jgi:hypothetical protein
VPLTVGGLFVSKKIAIFSLFKAYIKKKFSDNLGQNILEHGENTKKFLTKMGLFQVFCP